MSKKKQRYTKYLFIPDSHVPYQDQRAFELMIQIAKEYGIDVTVILGDFGDIATISRHVVDGVCKFSIDEELSRIGYALDQVEEIGAKRQIYLEGNHEKRLATILSAAAPEMRAHARKLDISHQLDLKGRGWEFVEYHDHIKLSDRFYVCHDFGAAGKSAVLQGGSVYGSNLVFGHTHRLAAAYDGDVEHGTRVVINAGHLMDLQYVKYMPKIKIKDWQLGFAVATVDNETSYVYAQPIPIIKKGHTYSAHFNGKTYITKKGK